MTLPSVEITITLDDTSTEPDRRKNGSKEQTATAATVDEQADVEPSQTSEGTRSQAPVKEQPSPRPRRLPFLNEIRSRSPVNTDSPGVRGQRRLPFIMEILGSRRRRASSASKNTSDFGRSTSNEVSTEYVVDAEDEGRVGTGVGGGRGRGGSEGMGSRGDLSGLGECIKSGQLLKTSRSRMEGSKPGPSRFRRFRLTEESLEYFQQFSHVKIKRSYPLTSVENITYDEKEPMTFNLIFSTYIMTLHADTVEDASDWVKNLNDAWSKWHIRVPSEDEGKPENLQVEECQESVSLEIRTPSPTEDEPQLDKHVKQPLSKKRSDPRQRSYTNPVMLRRESSEVEFETYDYRRNRISNQARKIGQYARLRPRLEKAAPVVGRDAEISATHKMLQKDSAMIKYPRRLLGIPHEKLFKLDKDKLQLLWRRNLGSKFRQSSSLSLHKIVEVREGQNTEKFDKFPFEQVEHQSFSLIFEEEYKKRYVRLSSLDVICDHPDNFSTWMKGLRSLVSGPQWCSIYPTQYQDTDPTILWLKKLWSCKSSQKELPEKAALKLALKFNPALTAEKAKLHVIDAHHHQFRHTFQPGALRWDGFTLLFNLLCGTTNSRLFTVFRSYAKTYPKLGLTQEEFREFLIKECCWKPRDCRPSVLQEMMRKHDFHHRAFKKFAAQNKPFEYQVADKLFSYAGFISFLRSKDNSAINPEHETVFQDMTQPLSHYFINSSHNTYLEGDQLRGKSSTDAYVRAFLQGCRCVEIDCWDDTLNVTKLETKEPIIYHGFTLTTKLPFREVIHTIKEYGFTSSIYPVVISIENHCNKSNQVRMAKIFRAIFDEMLPKEDLVELEGRARLPSPQELQGKIILKGTYKRDDPKSATAKRAHKYRQRTSLPTTSLTSVASNTSTPSHSAPTSPLHSLSPKQSSTDLNGHNNVEETAMTEGTDSPTPPTNHDQPDSNGATFSESHYHDNQPHPLSTRERFSRSKARSLRNIQRKLVETEQGQDDQELMFTETVGDLKSLILYAKSTSIKPWDWKRQKATSVTQMFSFGEPTAVQLCTTCIRDVLACTERQLVRTYPKGTRFDSSNYDPLLMWKCGVQMVALNFQYPDIYMHLNQGFFRLNGGCGYVLKPAVMRKEDPGGSRRGSAPFNPEMQVQHPEVPAVNFGIELISGQRLCPWKKKCSSVTVEIHTYGITHDCTKMEPAHHTNMFWPQWKPDHHKIEKKILMPELCLVYFRVEVDKRLYGQNCIPLISFQPGIKFIPLRTTGGELIPESGVFVRISKVEVEEIQASSLRGARLSRQHEFNNEDDLKGLSVIPENEEETNIPEDVDVLKSINLLEFSQKQKSPSNHPRPMSSPPLLEATSLDGDSEKNGMANSNRIVVTVDVNDKAEEDTDTVTETVSGLLESVSASKPRSLTIQADPDSNVRISEDGLPVVGVAETESVKEYHLHVKRQQSQV